MWTVRSAVKRILEEALDVSWSFVLNENFSDMSHAAESFGVSEAFFMCCKCSAF